MRVNIFSIFLFQDRGARSYNSKIITYVDIWFKKRIRFKGVDTWESRTRNLEEKALGLKAKARTKELLEKVSSKSGYFRIKSYGLGKYGRVLADVFIMDKDGKQWNVNETLITEGHAYVYDGGKKKVFTS